jgi:DNA-binding transcriptional regulator YiaG
MGGLGMSKLQFIVGGKPDDDGDTLHYRACGLDDVYLLGGFTRETVDGEEFITIKNLDGLWKAISLHLVTKRKVLSPKEIKFLREHMGFTQAKLGARMRVTDQTVARWEKGVTLIPGSADIALRFLFLTSKYAQPEGRKVLEKTPEFSEEIVEYDDDSERQVVFRHGRRSWSGGLQLAI